MPEDQQRAIMSELEKRESDYMRLQRQRMSADDFEPLTIIGRGAFGEVRAAAPTRRRAARGARRAARAACALLPGRARTISCVYLPRASGPKRVPKPPSGRLVLIPGR